MMFGIFPNKEERPINFYAKFDNEFGTQPFCRTLSQQERTITMVTTAQWLIANWSTFKNDKLANAGATLIYGFTKALTCAWTDDERICGLIEMIMKSGEEEDWNTPLTYQKKADLLDGLNRAFKGLVGAHQNQA